MALSTYAELQTSIAAWLARDDLTDSIPDFIRLVESRASRELRVREMVTDTYGTITDQVIVIPDDFMEMFRFVLDTEEDRLLEFRPFEDAHKRAGGSATGEPEFYTVFGERFIVYPSPDAEYTYALAYYAAIPALSDTATTNWLLEKAPDFYLFGALAEAAPYLMDDARVGYWESRYQAVRASLNGVERRSKRTSGPQRMRVMS